MRICETSEAFIEQNGDFVFSHTKIIARKGDAYFYAITRERTTRDIRLDQLDFVSIPIDDIWPSCPPELPHVLDSPPKGSFFKQPSLLQYGDTPASTKFSDTLLNEAKVCETLRAHQHRNIAAYLGCVVSKGRIIGLCFTKYQVTLPEWAARATLPEKRRCLEGIERGMKHLHFLGLVHNDLNPSNILIDDDNEPVIVDFDSCKMEGEDLGLKAGTVGWAKDGTLCSERDNDLYGLSKLRDYLIPVAVNL